MQTKLSYSQYQALLLDEQSDEKLILSYSIIEQGKGQFDWVLRPNPDKVELSVAELEAENAMNVANAFCRSRRHSKFRRQRREHPAKPVLVSEGDSWFQFPLLIKEVIDHLSDDYAVYSVGAAGDTATNMIFEANKKNKTEYLRALHSQKDSVKAFLFSAAGNDIIGENPETGDSALYDILKDFNSDLNDINGHINFSVFEKRLATLKSGYTTVVNNIRAESDFEALPILIHGYDYVFPFPFGGKDPRAPFYTKHDNWLGKPLKKRGIPTHLGREIIKVLINGLYDMLNDVAGSSNISNVWVIDCRGAMPNLDDWNDEIHGTSNGFKAVADRFKSVLINNQIH